MRCANFITLFNTETTLQLFECKTS